MGISYEYIHFKRSSYFIAKNNRYLIAFKIIEFTKKLIWEKDSNLRNNTPKQPLCNLRRLLQEQVRIFSNFIIFICPQKFRIFFQIVTKKIYPKQFFLATFS